MTFQNISRICGLLSNEHRLAILHKINQEGEISNEDLQKQFDQIPNMSSVLKPLRDANLLWTKKNGRSALYLLNRESPDFPIIESILEEATIEGKVSPRKKLLAVANS